MSASKPQGDGAGLVSVVGPVRVVGRVNVVGAVSLGQPQGATGAAGR